jgi:hypothetical protein
MTISALASVLLALAIPSASAVCGPIAKLVTFTGNHPYTKDYVKSDWAPTTFVDGYWGDQSTEGDNNERASVVDGSLRLLLPEGCIKKECAMQIKSGLPESLESATLRYSMRFSKDFDWVKGGKLPGLCGAKCLTGCKVVTGDDGWSMRSMWRPCVWPPTPHAPPCEGGKLAAYLYHADKVHNCGDDVSYVGEGDELFRPMPEEWIDVTVFVAMNTAGPRGGSGGYENDGVVRVWADGELVVEREDLAWRSYDDIGIDTFYLSVFYGGGQPDWAPPKDNSIDFSGFEIREGECPPEGDTGKPETVAPQSVARSTIPQQPSKTASPPPRQKATESAPSAKCESGRCRARSRRGARSSSRAPRKGV